MHYTYLLLFHSYYRWVILLCLAVQLLWLIYHKRQQTLLNRTHFKTLLLFTFLYNIQLLLGWALYLSSPIVTQFWSDIAIYVKHRQMRFFGMEHVAMMTAAIMLININTLLVHRKIGRPNVFVFIAKYYIWIILIILSSIPWSFSPLTSRPNFR